MLQFATTYMTFYWSAIVTPDASCTVFLVTWC